jgi:hypothetical protein
LINKIKGKKNYIVLLCFTQNVVTLNKHNENVRTDGDESQPILDCDVEELEKEFEQRRNRVREVLTRLI